jgi:hypothetical protein
MICVPVCEHLAPAAIHRFPSSPRTRRNILNVLKLSTREQFRSFHRHFGARNGWQGARMWDGLNSPWNKRAGPMSPRLPARITICGEDAESGVAPYTCQHGPFNGFAETDLNVISRILFQVAWQADLKRRASARPQWRSLESNLLDQFGAVTRHVEGAVQESVSLGQ